MDKRDACPVTPMRWPIRLQLLLAILSVVVMALVLAVVVSANLAISAAGRRQAEQLDRVVNTLTESNFPLSRRVLEQMSGLSGGQFVVLDGDRRVMYGTVPLADDDLGMLLDIGGREPSGSVTHSAELELDGRVYFVDLVPVARPGRAVDPRWLVVLYPKDRRWESARQAAFPIVAAGLVAVLLAVVVAAVLAGRLVRPLKALGARAEAIAAGSFKPVDVPSRNDELADLADAINRMTEKLSRFEEEVRRNERLRTLGQLGAGIAHQVRNSATGARIAIELHQGECSAGEDSQTVRTALRQLELMESYLQRFLHLGTSSAAKPQRVDMQAVVDDVLQLVRPSYEHAKVGLHHQAPDQPIVVQGDPGSLRELAINLLLNALEAVGRSAEPDARVSVQLELRDTRRALLRVSDTGRGPDPELAPRMFDPFVSQKPEGTGLGLYLAGQIAEDHHGSIDWQRYDGMTHFIVELPVCESS